MLPIKRKQIDSTTEKRILLGMITSTKYLKEIYQHIDYAYFKNSYIEKVVRWISSYFESYESAPNKEIQSLFEKKAPTLSTDEEEIIRGLLVDVSNKYDSIGDINPEVLVDDSFRYFKKRELEIIKENLEILLDNNDIDKAEDQILSYKRPDRIISSWVNPFDPEEIEKVFANRDETFFQFPGVLGEFMGPMEKGWLVGIAGPFKRGKTFFAYEFGIMGMLMGRKVAIISLEMSTKQIEERIYKRLYPSGPSDMNYLYPVFDCKLNQIGTCEKPERKNHTALHQENTEKPSFDSNLDYSPCTVCRGTNDFETAVWYEMIKRPEFEYGNVSKEMEDYNEHYGHLLRVISYPRFSASVQDMERGLDILADTEDYFPEIIIPDYADILRLEGVGGVEKEDIVWMELARLASERHALEIVPTQLTKEALEAEIIRQTHTARWIGKLGHVDAMHALNQTYEEKNEGRMRVSCMIHRHRNFNPDDTVSILQKLDLGQVHLDSERT